MGVHGGGSAGLTCRKGTLEHTTGESGAQLFLKQRCGFPWRPMRSALWQVDMRDSLSGRGLHISGQWGQEGRAGPRSSDSVLDERGSRRASRAGGRFGPWLGGAGGVLLGRRCREPRAGCSRRTSDNFRQSCSTWSPRGKAPEGAGGRSRVKGGAGSWVEATVHREREPGSRTSCL